MARDPAPRRSPAMIGVVDFRRNPIFRSSSGRWTSALFIIGNLPQSPYSSLINLVNAFLMKSGVEIAERMAYYGISFNLITYLTGPLRFPTAAAASAVNSWSGFSMLIPLLGAFVADSYLGRYLSIVIASVLYVLGLGLLTFSAVLSNHCSRDLKYTLDPSSCPPSTFKVGFFYLSLYLVAFAEGGHKPCVQAFGADQFDENDDEERAARSSFFNWWYFGINLGVTASYIVLSYIQDNLGWGLGFGIPSIVMGIALLVFLLGSRFYRCYPLEVISPFVRIGKGVAAMIMSRKSSTSKIEAGDLQHEWGSQSDQYTKLMDDGKFIDNEPIKEAKGVLRLFPIGAACLGYAIVFSQSSTLFNKQGNTMDRKIVPSFQIPSAALQSIISIVIVVFIPFYDRVFVPITRNLSGIPTGITQLQRIGIGLMISVFSMAIAALVESKRIQIAKEHGLIDEPDATVPMSVLWLFPQYILLGIIDVFTMVGLQEFFYDQVPDGLRSLGLALYLSIYGMGSFISSFLISAIDRLSTNGGESWFSNDLNRAHLDYFYWLLAGICSISLGIFVYAAKSYVYKPKEF